MEESEYLYKRLVFALKIPGLLFLFMKGLISNWVLKFQFSN